MVIKNLATKSGYLIAIATIVGISITIFVYASNVRGILLTAEIDHTWVEAHKPVAALDQQSLVDIRNDIVNLQNSLDRIIDKYDGLSLTMARQTEILTRIESEQLRHRDLLEQHIMTDATIASSR